MAYNSASSFIYSLLSLSRPIILIPHSPLLQTLNIDVKLSYSELFHNISGNKSFSLKNYITEKLIKLCADVINKCTLIIEAASSDVAPIKLILKPLFKYVPSVDTTELKDIATLIDSKLDFAKEFDYTYVVSEDELIENPLESISFLDSNHVFNRFTMCRWDTESEDNKLIVVSKFK